MIPPDDPRSWGYLPLGTSKDAVYEPDSKATSDTSIPDPFILHLAGRGGIDIPHTLRDVVRVHRDLDYEEFYDLMHTMDLVLPAFSDDSCASPSSPLLTSHILISFWWLIFRLRPTSKLDVRHGTSKQRPYIPFAYLHLCLRGMFS